MCIIAIVLGTQLFEKQNCLERWFVSDDVLCKDCVVHYGEECLGCNETLCNNCTAGYFWATQDDNTTGIVAVNETRCRACQTQHGPNCLICD